MQKIVGLLALAVTVSCSASSTKSHSPAPAPGPAPQPAPPPAKPKTLSLIVNPSSLALADLVANDLRVDEKADETEFDLNYTTDVATPLVLVGINDLPKSCLPGAGPSWDAQGPGGTALVSGQTFTTDARSKLVLIVRIHHTASCGAITGHLLVQAAPLPPQPPQPPVKPAAIPDGATAVPPGASVTLMGKLSDSEGCKPNFTRTVAEGMALREPQADPGDSAPYLKETVDASDLDHEIRVAFLHLGVETSLYTFNVDANAAPGIRQALVSGKSAVIGSDDCTDHTAFPFGILRSEPEPLSGAAASYDFLGIATDASSNALLNVSYGYDAANLGWTATWTTTETDADLVLAPDVRYAFYNWQAEAFLTDWVPAKKDILKSGTVTVTDVSALHRLIPRQYQVYLVIEGTTPTGTARYILNVDACTRDDAGKTFHDLSHPGRKCAEVKESDLPTR